MNIFVLTKDPTLGPQDIPSLNPIVIFINLLLIELNSRSHSINIKGWSISKSQIHTDIYSNKCIHIHLNCITEAYISSNMPLCTPWFALHVNL